MLLMRLMEPCFSIRILPEQGIPITETFAEKVIRNFECNIEQKENNCYDSTIEYLDMFYRFILSLYGQ